MVHTSPATRKQFQQDYDDYGDSFTADVTEDQLRHIFSVMDKVILKHKINSTEKCCKCSLLQII